MLYPTETDDDEGASLIEVGEEASGEAGGESDGEAKKKKKLLTLLKRRLKIMRTSLTRRWNHLHSLLRHSY